MQFGHDYVIVLDFGGLGAQSAARRIRECRVYSEILSYDTPVGELTARKPQAIVFAGEPPHTPDDKGPRVDPALYEAGIPILAPPQAAQILGETSALKEFLYKTCGCRGDWTMTSFMENMVSRIRAEVGEGRVLCGLSGGVDSAVAAALVHRAVGDRLTCVFVDQGLMRKGEPEEVRQLVRGLNMRLVYADAADRFLTRLAGVTDPEKKRKIIGTEFIRVFEEEAAKLGPIDYLVQGTLYPDVAESGAATAGMIKSHHNVGGLPEDMKFQLIEPLKWLFKDEVRRLGEEMGLPENIVWRQPFPGPGLAVRILGEITREKLAILREADAIATDEIRKAGLYREVWQSFVVLPAMKSVGVRDGARTYTYTAVLRAVDSTDGTAAEWVRLPHEVLAAISARIVAEVPEINRVVYDITPKPPGTIEWE